MTRIQVRNRPAKQLDLFIDVHHHEVRYYYNEVAKKLYDILRIYQTLPDKNRNYEIDLGSSYGIVEVNYDLALYLLDVTQLVQSICSRIPVNLGGGLVSIDHKLPKLPEPKTTTRDKRVVLNHKVTRVKLK